MFTEPSHTDYDADGITVLHLYPIQAKDNNHDKSLINIVKVEIFYAVIYDLRNVFCIY